MEEQKEQKCCSAFEERCAHGLLSSTILLCYRRGAASVGSKAILVPGEPATVGEQVGGVQIEGLEGLGTGGPVQQEILGP